MASDLNLAAYETPYVIWANGAAAEALDWESAVEALALPRGGEISACFFGAALLELTGRGEAAPWFAFLNQLRREAPVIQRETVLLSDGTLAQGLPETLKPSVDKWRQWSYYKLQYKEVP